MKGLPIVTEGTAVRASRAAPPSRAATKDGGMERQKLLLAAYFAELARTKETGRRVAYSFVPGNLTELMRIFGVLPVYPEINALQSGMRQRSDELVREAERLGHSEDVCAYVKCDIGMMAKGNIGPTGTPLPRPDILLLSYTGCFTFLKWFELLRNEYRCPIAMLQVPYCADGTPTEGMRRFVADQLRKEVIPLFERTTGVRYDEARLQEALARSGEAEDDLVRVLESARHRPSPIDAYFGGVYYIGPIFTAFRGSQECVDYYRALREEIEGRIARREGPLWPDGSVREERFRLVVEGPPNWTHFRDFWRIFYEEGAVVVASTYTKVGGLYDRGFRHRGEGDPLLCLADYCLGCYTNLSLPERVRLIGDYIRDYEADGFLFNSIKSCKSFSAGQLVMLQELEKETGLPGAFVETDLVDSRYYSQANVKNRIESYLQMLAQRRSNARA